MTMIRIFLLLIFVVQLSSGQFAVRLRYNVELTEPSPPEDKNTIPYTTWSNGFMFGSDLEVGIDGPLAWSITYDYQKRHFEHFDPPPDYFGNSTTGPTRGGDGTIWRLALGLKFFVSPIERIRVFAQASYAMTVQKYENVYFSTWADDIGYMEHGTHNPTSVFTGPYFRGGIDVLLFSPVGLSGSLAAIQGEHGGYFLQGSTGLLIAL